MFQFDEGVFYFFLQLRRSIILFLYLFSIFFDADHLLEQEWDFVFKSRSQGNVVFLELNLKLFQRD